VVEVGNQWRSAACETTPVGDRWLNAVIEVTVPLDLPIDASGEEKRDAIAEQMERIGMPPDAVATGRCELVDDGEPVARPTRAD
jgi:hypothetical protein